MDAPPGGRPGPTFLGLPASRGLRTPEAVCPGCWGPRTELPLRVGSLEEPQAPLLCFLWARCLLLPEGWDPYPAVPPGLGALAPGARPGLGAREAPYFLAASLTWVQGWEVVET